MFAACAFWTMKITATTAAAKPAISLVCISLVQVCRRRRPGGCGAGRGAEPLAEGGGSVPVVLYVPLLPSEAGPARPGRSRLPCGPIRRCACLIALSPCLPAIPAGPIQAARRDES